MKKWQQISSIGLASMLVLAACGEEEATPKNEQSESTKVATEQTETQFPMTLKDALDKEVTVEKAPERIISLIPSNTEILFGLGLDEQIIGVNDNDNYPAEAAEKEKIGGQEFNLEQIIALQPDLVVAHESGLYSFGEEAIAQLESVGIPVFVVKNALTFEETYTTIEQIGQLTGKTSEAADMITSIKEGIADIETKVTELEEKSVFVLVGAEPDLYAAGQETFIDEMLDLLHIENVVPELGWPQYSAEQFVKSNADVILVTYESDLQAVSNNTAYSEMNAVKSGNVKLIDGDTTSRQGPRIVEGIESIAEAIYPEAFNE
ncbi:ABC transporter substrate-binding protein [Lysinibacillus sp. 2017]|uniref:ABC transporter substrate-binding protein n=1 Tax=unclassified Lysinibacillus TaxID=2636778 RepID=UPI000D527C7A|nr:MULTISPECIES: ABC transporter substrate-binding protein [unclassified Lysinibacillus]AWE06268.1 ABC transporter substrate-binding protein [Lysinibacillus sp. 2017]TGN35256.1 ABC transporter substrate-binding protein [Lysinibacillus sp. S2017]